MSKKPPSNSTMAKAAERSPSRGGCASSNRSTPDMPLRKVAFSWALIVLTVLVFLPFFVPQTSNYVLLIASQLLVLVASMTGVRYTHRRRTGSPAGD